MVYFELYQNQGLIIGTLLCLGLNLIAVTIYFSVRHYKKPCHADGSLDVHAEPGIPLILKGLYLGIAIYIIAATYIVAKTGIAI
jgi:hypothetical protein